MYRQSKSIEVIPEFVCTNSGAGIFIPTRLRKRNLKQICLWDLAQDIWIAFIIQTA